MARIVPPGYAACSIEHWLAGYNRPAVTTIGAKITGSEDGLNTVASDFAGLFFRAFASELDTNVFMRNAKAVIGQDGGEPVIQEWDPNLAGTASRNSLPPAMALMLTKRTAVGGRKNRGRMYMPWAIPEDQVGENGSVSTGHIGRWVSRCNAFTTDFTRPTTVDPSLISGWVVLHSDSTPPTPVTSMSPNQAIRTQRRRQVRF